MNNGDREFLGRLDERMKNMHEDVKDIQKKMSHVKGCVNENVTKIATLKTNLENHVKSHDVSRGWKMLIPSVVAIAVAAVALLIRVGG